MLRTFDQRLALSPPPPLKMMMTPNEDKLKKRGLTGLPASKDGVPLVKLPFPYKLYKLLDDADRGIHSNIISWMPDGTSFKIHNAKAFSDTVMSTYFNQSKYKSFTRQCELSKARRQGKSAAAPKVLLIRMF